MYEDNIKLPNESQDQPRTAGWTPFISAAERIGQLSSGFENAFVGLNAYNDNSRGALISIAIIMKTHLSSVSTPEELIRFNEILFNLKRISMDMSKALTNKIQGPNQPPELNASAFRDWAEAFLDHYNAVAYRAHLLYAITKDTDDSIVKALKSQQIWMKPYFKEAGLMISPQLWLQARMFANRALDNRDTILLISAERGSGKSVYALTLATVLSAMLNVPFDLQRQCIFQQKRDQVKEILTSLPNHSTLILDQAGAQLGSRTSMHGNQIQMLNEIDFARSKGRCLIINWHSNISLDKEIKNMATAIIEIPKRASAIFKSPNLNTRARGPTPGTAEERSQVITDVNSAHEISLIDQLTLFRIPYKDLETKNTEEAKALWTRYSILKEDAGKKKDDNSGRLLLDPSVLN